MPDTRLSDATLEVAARRGVVVGSGSCVCGHGLVWHDTDDLRCQYGIEHRYEPKPLCPCRQFHVG